MFRLIKKCLSNINWPSLCISLNNQKCMTQPTLINLHFNEYIQKLHTIHLRLYSIGVGSCNTLNDLSNKVYVPNKTEDLNLSVFNMITGINESKTFTKHISCERKCKFYYRKCNSSQKWNNDK